MGQFDQLTDDIVLNIFRFFNKRDHARASLVNKRFYTLSKNQTLQNLPWPELGYSQPPYNVTTLTSHPYNFRAPNIHRLAVLPNGYAVLVTWDDSPGYKLSVWDIEKRQCQTLTGEHANCTILALSNGQIVSGCCTADVDDKTLRLWDIAQGGIIKILDSHSHTGGVLGLTELPNGHVVSAYEDNTLKVWDIEKGLCIASMNIAPKFPSRFVPPSLTSLLALSTGQVICCLTSSAIEVWDVTVKCKRLYSLYGHSSYIDVLVELPNSQLLSASRDNTLKLWDIERRVCLHTSKENKDVFITSLALLPNRKQVMVASTSSIRVWDIEQRRYLYNLTDKDHVATLAFLPTGQLITLGKNGLQHWLFPELKFEHTVRNQM